MLSQCLGSGTPCGPLGGSGALALCLGGMDGRSVGRRYTRPGSTAPKVVTRTIRQAPFLSLTAGMFRLLVIGAFSDLLALDLSS